MNVYVESNFVLELALLQEQHESCQKVIELAETTKIKLIIPAYSLIEPFETIIRNAKARSKTTNDLAKELNQLSRSKPYHEEMHAFQKITGFLVRSQEEEKERLRETINKLLNVSTIIPLIPKFYFGWHISNSSRFKSTRFDCLCFCYPSS